MPVRMGDLVLLAVFGLGWVLGARGKRARSSSTPLPRSAEVEKPVATVVVDEQPASAGIHACGSGKPEEPDAGMQPGGRWMNVLSHGAIFRCVEVAAGKSPITRVQQVDQCGKPIDQPRDYSEPFDEVVDSLKNLVPL